MIGPNKYKYSLCIFFVVEIMLFCNESRLAKYNSLEITSARWRFTGVHFFNADKIGGGYN